MHYTEIENIDIEIQTRIHLCMRLVGLSSGPERYYFHGDHKLQTRASISVFDKCNQWSKLN